MNYPRIQRTLSFVGLCAYLTLCASPSYAQSLVVGGYSDPEILISTPPTEIAIPDPEILVSTPPLAMHTEDDITETASTEQVTQVSTPSKQNMQSSLVNIKAVDAPAIHTENGKTGIASTERFGHGVIIDPSGIIATNTHIIANAQHIYVDLNGDKTYEATILYSSNSDISFIKINVPYRLNPIIWGPTSELKAGTPIIAFDDSDSENQSTLDGKVIDMMAGKRPGDVNLLALKLHLAPGDSGGPILDEQGDLVGLIMARSNSDNNLCFAISADKIQREYLKYQATA